MTIDFIHVNFKHVPDYNNYPTTGWHIIPACRRNAPILSIENAVNIISKKLVLEEDWQERCIVNELEYEIQNISRCCIRIISYEIKLYAQIPEWWYRLGNTLKDIVNDVTSICMHLPIMAVHGS